MTNLLRINPNAKHLNEMAHRHSFNESIYSEPYGGRFVAGSGLRLESNHPNLLSESASASNIYSGKIATATQSHPQYLSPQNSLSHRDVYATTSSIASNGYTAEVSSTRSSVYSDRTILNEQTPPITSRSSQGINEQTIKATNPNNSTASNATGSHAQAQANLQSKPIQSNTITEVQTTQTNLITLVNLSPITDSNGVDQSKSNRIEKKLSLKLQLNDFYGFIIESEEINETTAPVMRRQKNINNNSAERSVRRISYLRATANDISLQESEKVEECVNEIRDDKPSLSEELQLLAQFFRRYDHHYQFNE